MAVKVPEISLPGTRGYPMLGLGTFTIFGQTGNTDEIKQAVLTAIDAGYRHFDCAFSYTNEKYVGDAIQEKIKSGVIKREDVFITTKLYETHHDPSKVQENCMKSITALQCGYLDLYLLHWPFGFKDGDDRFPRDENGKILYSDHDYVETYKAMEKLLETGLVKAIGISNFNSKQVERLLQNCTVKPVNLQIEVNPYFQNDRLIDYCRERGMTITAYAPFGNPTRTWLKEDDPVVLKDPTLLSIAKAKNKSIAQVILRFLHQRNIVVIPKSVTASRIKENIQIFDFELSNDEMEKIKAVNRNFRYYAYSEVSDHKYYPFAEEF